MQNESIPESKKKITKEDLEGVKDNPRKYEIYLRMISIYKGDKLVKLTAALLMFPILFALFYGLAFGDAESIIVLLILFAISIFLYTGYVPIKVLSLLYGPYLLVRYIPMMSSSNRLYQLAIIVVILTILTFPVCLYFLFFNKDTKAYFNRLKTTSKNS